jgi:hypothetical protein
MARKYARDKNGRFSSAGGGRGAKPKTSSSKGKSQKLPGDGLFNELFRGKATRKVRGAKSAYEPGKGRYLKMAEAKKSAAKEAGRENQRRIRSGQRGTWNS